MNEVKEIAEQMFQQGYIEGKRADIIAGVYDILTSERNIAGNPALAIRICDYVSDEVRKEILEEVLTDSKKAIAAFLIRGGYTDDLDCAETINLLNCIFEPVEKKYGIKVK